LTRDIGKKRKTVIQICQSSGSNYCYLSHCYMHSMGQTIKSPLSSLSVCVSVCLSVCPRFHCRNF